MGEEEDREDDDEDDDDEGENDVADAEEDAEGVDSTGGCENRYDDDVAGGCSAPGIVGIDGIDAAAAARSSLIHTFLSLLT